MFFRFQKELHVKCKYIKIGLQCPSCKSYNTYRDDASGIRWCGDCGYEW